MTLWLDGNDLSTLFQDSGGTTPVTTDGQPVGRWNDKSGAGNNATQTRDNNARPIFTTNGFNGKPALRFTTDDITTPFNANTANMSLFIVYCKDAANGGLWGHDNGGWDRLQIFENNGPWNFGAGGSAIQVPGLNNTTTNIYAPLLAGGVANGSVIYVNGTSQLVFTDNNSSGQNSTTFGAIESGGGWQLANTRIAEVLIYNRVLSSNEHNQVGGYLSWKYSLATAYPAWSPSAVQWGTPAVTNVTLTSAGASAMLAVSGDSNAVVTLYWGTTDGGVTNTAWASSNYLGTVSTGLLSNIAMTNLTPNTTYFYRFYGTNNVTMNEAYSAAGIVRTPASDEWTGAGNMRWGNVTNWASTNVPDTAGESARFIDKSTGTVDLAGSSFTLGALTFSGGGYTLADTNASPGTLTLSVVTNTTGNNTLDAGVTVGGAVTISGGKLTLAKTAAFGAGEFKLNGGALGLQGVGTFVTGIEMRGYHITPDALMDLNNNGGLMAQVPWGNVTLTGNLSFNGDGVFVTPGAVGQTSNFMILFLGYFNAPTTGNYDFIIDWGDDRKGLWLDLDRDGVFESSTPGLGSNRGEQLAWQDGGTKTVALTAGQSYLFAVTFGEYGGGESIQLRIKTPAMGSAVVCNPSDAGQSGLWTIGGRGPVALTNVPIQVVANSSLSADSSTNVTALGFLTVSNATLSTTAGSALTFLGTTIPAAATTAGFDAAVDTTLTQSQGLNGSGATATINKYGAGTLILNRAGLNLGSAAFNVQTGTLAAVHADAFGPAPMQLNRGELKLSSSGGDIAYTNAISVLQTSTLAAGQAGNGVTGAVTVTVNGTITFSGTQSLTNRATDGYTLRLGGEIVGSGTNVISAGTVIIDDTNFNAVTLSGGSLTVYSNLTVNSLIQNSGTFTMAGATKDLTVANAFTLAGALNMSGGPNLNVTNAAVALNSGGTLIYDKALTAASMTINSGGALTNFNPLAVTGTLDIKSGGTLSIGTNAINAASVIVRSTANLGLTGPIAATTAMTFYPTRTVTNLLTGTANVFIGDPQDGNEAGSVTLIATNAYTGYTQIRRAVLAVTDGIGLPTNSRVVFNSDYPARPAQVETCGTFARNIGTAAGQVFWSGRGGFSALGSNLTVVLNGGGIIDWSNGTTNGFNNQDAVLFNSATANAMVDLVNPINLNANNRYITVFNNRFNTLGNDVQQWGWSWNKDYARLSGTITGSGAWNGSEFKLNNWDENDNRFSTRSSLLELTGTNTYSQRTVIRASLFAIDGVGLPKTSTLFFQQTDASWYENVLLSTGTFQRCITSDSDIQGGVTWWWGSGGFAARGGPLTVGFTNAASPLNWGSNNRGFNGQYLQLNSSYANDLVTLTNNIALNGDRVFMVWDNVETNTDVAQVAGTLSGANTWLYKFGPGTLWLSGTNTYSHRTQIDNGAVRAVDGEGLPTASQIYFYLRDNQTDRYYGILESSGTLARTIGNSTGAYVYWDRAGGFAAWGGPLTVNLNGGAVLLWNDGSQGFRDQDFMLGSRTADNVVTISNRINVVNGWRTLRVYDNPYSQNDWAVLTGLTNTTVNNGHLYIHGDGLLKISGPIHNMNYIRVRERATLYINGTFSGNNVDTEASSTWMMQNLYPNAAERPTIGGSGVITANGEIRFRGYDTNRFATLAPGDGAGTLTASTASGFTMENYTCYNWELGPAASDKVAVTGNLTLSSGWKLKLLSAGGTPLTNNQYTFFTYSGACSYSAPAIDASAIPADWRTNTLQVIHDTTSSPKRIYLTGLYSVLSVANLQPTNLTSTSAVLNGVVSAQADPLYVTVYWGTNDGGTNAANWLATGFSADKGSFSGVTGQTVSHAIGGLNTNELWTYTFNATNAAGTVNLWAMPSMPFNALGPPVVMSTGASDMSAGIATLNGAFIGHNRGTVTFCWGTNDGGTNSPSNWQFSTNIGTQAGATFLANIGSVLYPLTYVVRCYAVNPYGESWSDPVTNFTQTVKPGPHLPATSSKAAAWFEASMGTTTDASGVVTWQDQSGFGHTATRNQGQTFLMTSQINGRPAVQFGDNTYLTMAGILYSKDQFIVTKMNGGDWGSWMGSDQQSGYMWNQNGNCWDQNIPSAVSKNATALSAYPFYLGDDRASQFMILRIRGNDNNTSVRTYYLGKQQGWIRLMNYMAEIITYSNALSAADEAQVGGYLAQKYGISSYTPVTVPYQVAPTLVNLNATNVGVTSGWMNGSLNCTGAVYDVWAFWGGTNQTTNAGAWGNTAYVGTYSDTVFTVTYPATGFSGDFTNWYTFLASNALDRIWATPSTNFVTVSTPAVNNSTGAAMTIGQATLRGNLTAGNRADITIYWGRSDGGQTTNYENVVTLPNILMGPFSTNISVGYGFSNYYYICFASNAAGTAWATAASNFSMPSPMPTPPASGLRVHYNASSIVGLSDGQTLTQWLDVSGNANHTTVQTGTPLYYSSIATLGNKPAVRMSNNSGFSMGNLSAQFPSAATLFLVASMTNESDYSLLETANNDSWWRYGDGWSYPGPFRSGRINNYTTMPTAGSYIFEIQSTSTNWEMRMNGTSKGNQGGGYSAGNNYLLGTYNSRFLNGEMAEVLIYNRPLTLEERNTCGTYLSLKYNITSTYAGSAAEASITNTPVSNLTTNSATLNGELPGAGWSFDVYVYWGLTNGTTVAANWQTNAYVGTFHSYTGPVSWAVSGLAPTSQYFYAFYATNTATNVWAQPSGLFETLGPVTASNGPATNITQTQATLGASLARGGQGTLRIYWGLSNGDTNAGSWENTNSFGDVLIGTYTTTVTVRAGGPYFYRAYATNTFGADWADATAQFSTPVPAVSLSVSPVTAGFSPTNIAGCEAWYSAATLALTNGAAVTAWSDSSTNGRHLVTYEGTPNFKTNAINGLPAVNFQNESLQMAVNNPYFPKEVYVVFRSTSGTSGFGSDWNAPIGVKDGDDNNRMWMMEGGNDRFWDQELPSAVSRNGVGVTSANNFDMGDINTGQYMVLKVTAGPNNGTQVREIIVGSRTDAWNGGQYDTAEIIAYNRQLSTAEENLVGRYLAAKYGLSTAYSLFDEKGGQARVTATLSAPSVSNVTVNFSFGGGAVKNTDYSSSADSVVITAGTLSSNILLTATDDADAEEDEPVTVSLQSLEYATNGTPTAVTNSITSDDPQVTNGSGASSVTASNAVLNGTLTMGDSAAIRVFWGDNNGGTDFSLWDATNEMGTWNEDTAFATNITGLLANKTYYYRCYSTNASLLGWDWADSSASFTTIGPTVSVDNVLVTEGNSGEVNATFTLWLSTLSLLDVAVTCAASDGTATAAGGDYAPTSGVVTIPAGQPSATFTVKVKGDGLYESPDEIFYLNLSSPSNAALGDAQGVGTIHDDDLAVYLTNWLYKMKITVAGYTRSETLTNFPALVVLKQDDSGFRYYTMASPSGADLRFANSNETTLLNHEVELWNTSSNSTVWVQVPELTGSNAFIWAYWGNTNAMTAPAYTTNGSVWTGGFHQVYHMTEPAARDWTTNRLHGSLTNAAVNTATGLIATALSFTESGAGAVTLPFYDRNSAPYTLSAWIQTTDNNGAILGWIFYEPQDHILMQTLNGKLRFFRNWWTSSSEMLSAQTVADGQWHYCVAKRSANDVGRLYIDGVQVTTNGAIGTTRGGGSSFIGRTKSESWGLGVPTDYYFDGLLDELRVCDADRSADWIWACYSNQVQGSAFLRFGPMWGLPIVDIVDGATNVTSTSACLTARLSSTGGTQTAVTLYWGLTDGGQTPANWGHTQAMGTATSAPQTYSVSITNLPDATRHYYAYRAVNASGTNWAFTNFFSLGRPVVNNGSGPMAAAGYATLNGNLLSTGSAPATVYTCWGDNDGGTNMGAWDQGITNGVIGIGPFQTNTPTLIFGVPYSYRCVASNSWGMGWAPETLPFAPLNPVSGRRLKISFTNYTGAVLTNFPALVRLGTNITNFTYGNFLSTNGFDLRLWNDLETTNLNYEIDHWDTNGISTVWVQIPLFTNNCYVWADWGSESNRPAYTTNGATWSEGFAGVWHLGVTGGVVNLRDSTSNGLHGVKSGTLAVTNNSPIGSGMDLNGSSYASMAGIANNPSVIEQEVWIKTTTDGRVILTKRHVDDGADWASIDTANNHARVACDDGGYWGGTEGTRNVVDGQWHHLAGMKNGTAFSIYTDGQLDNSCTEGHAMSGSSYDFHIGHHGAWNSYFVGQADEVRVSYVTRSADWIRATWTTVASNSTFTTYTYSPGGGAGTALANLAASNVTQTSATFVASMNATGATYTVAVLWGTGDGMTNTGAWANTNLMGTYTNVPTTNLTFDVPAGLTPGTIYYYAFRSWNSETNIVAQPSACFYTLGPPVVDNGNGATSGIGTATLRGNLLSTGGAPVTVYTYWGDNDGGTNKQNWDYCYTNGATLAGPFSNSVSNLIYGIRYYYRAYGSNSIGGGWALTPTNFVTQRPLASSIPSGAQAWYKFDDSGNLGKDSGPNTNDLVTATGSPAYSSSGKFGGGLYLDGSSTMNKGGVFPAGLPTGGSAFTIALWVKDNGSGAAGGFVGWGINDTSQCNNFRFNGNSQLINYWWSNDWILGGLSPDPKDGNWRHIAVTWDSGAHVMYVDGVQAGTESRAGLNAQAANFVVGKTTGDVNFKGWMDDLLIANRALTAPEITNLVNNFYSTGGMAVSLLNSPATGVSSNAATLNATLACTNATYDVYAHWNTVNGGTNASLWTNSVYLGSWTNIGSTNLSHTAALAQNRVYYFTFRGSNAAEVMWATNVQSFITPGPLGVDNLGGAVNLFPGLTRLNGRLYSETADVVRIYWGTTDGGTNAAAWARTNTLASVPVGPFNTTASNLVYGLMYYYRCAASNGNGTVWADSTVDFTTMFPMGEMATGGTVTNLPIGGTNYTMHVFTNSGTFSVLVTGSVDALVVAGGGAGGSSGLAGGGGGGGAGGLLFSNAMPVVVSNYAITVGPGGGCGTGTSATSTNGSNSVFATLLAYGGGFGGRANGSISPGNGGSGGGAHSDAAGTVGIGTNGQGRNGGTGTQGGGGQWTGGGGGGAGAVGGTGVAIGGVGGNGLDYSAVFGTAVGESGWFAGGGGGNRQGSADIGVGGNGGGGDGGTSALDGIPGLPNTGGGGGAAGTGRNAGFGGSGVVILRYRYDVAGVGITNTGPAVVTNGTATMTGILRSSNAVFNVYLHYGTNNAGTGTWANEVFVGAYSNVGPTNLSKEITGLSKQKTYYWRFEARNICTNLWAQPVESFQTLAWDDGDADSDGVTDVQEAIAGTDPNDAASVMKITAMTPTNAVDIRLQFVVGSNRTVAVLAADRPGQSKTVIGTVTNSQAVWVDTNWVNIGAVNAATQRFYSLRVSYGGDTWTNAEEWAMYVQPRAAGQWYMAGAPVDFETPGENNLASTLGTQLMRGLQQGGEGSADLVWVLKGEQFVKHWVMTNVWYALSGTAKPTNTVISSGTGFWVRRVGNFNTNTVFTGKTRTNDTYVVNITTNWNFLTWPFRTERAEGAGAGTADVGWGFRKCGGQGSKVSTNADVIVVLKDNAWRRYRLLDGYGATVNGHWWDETRGGYADFTMQPGQGFYYFRRGTTGFVWTNSYGP